MLNAFRDFSNLTHRYSLQYGEKDGNAKTVLLADWHKVLENVSCHHLLF